MSEGKQKKKITTVRAWAVHCGDEECYCLTAYTVKAVANDNAMNGEKITPCTITFNEKRKP